METRGNAWGQTFVFLSHLSHDDSVACRDGKEDGLFYAAVAPTNCRNTNGNIPPLS